MNKVFIIVVSAFNIRAQYPIKLYYQYDYEIGVLIQFSKRVNQSIDLTHSFDV